MTSSKSTYFLRRSGQVLCLTLSCLMITGCFYSREISHTKKAIERSNPGLDLDREIVVSLGPMSLGFTRLIASLIPEDDEDFEQARGYIKYIKRVKVGVYNIDFNGEQYALSLPEEILEDHLGYGWDQLAKVKEDGEQVWVFYKSEGDRITELYTVVNDGDQLVVAKIKGDFTSLIERAVADHVDWSEIIGDSVGEALEF